MALDLRLWFHICKMFVFSLRGSVVTKNTTDNVFLYGHAFQTDKTALISQKKQGYCVPKMYFVQMLVT